MKRVERHHLKENELQNLARLAREAYEGRRRETTMFVGIAVLVGAVAIGYIAWRERVQSKAHALLAEAIVVLDAPISPPPAPGTPSQGLRFATERERAQSALTKLKTAADAYPSTDAGLYARYQEGATWMALGSPAQAASIYQQVIDRDSGIYGQMARLGLAEAQVRGGQYRSGHQGLSGSVAAQGWSAPRGRHPDAARSRVPRCREADRGPADVQSPR